MKWTNVADGQPENVMPLPTLTGDEGMINVITRTNNISQSTDSKVMNGMPFKMTEQWHGTEL